MSRHKLYTVPLADASVRPPDEAIQSQLNVAALLGGGLSAERVGLGSVDLTISGAYEYGERVARKAATELRSLNASDYGDIPVFDTEAADLGRKKGYYQVENVDVSEPHAEQQEQFSYRVALSESGTRETHWRAVETNPQSISAATAGSATDYIAIQHDANKVRWYKQGEGTESATIQETVEAEFGLLERYDPDEPTFDSPTLIYDMPYDKEARTDVFVYDTRGRKKFWTASRGTATVGTLTVGEGSVGESIRLPQWIRIFHTQHDFEGDRVIDTGRLRVRFDERNNLVRPHRWDGTTWTPERLSHTEYTLFDADIVSIDPAQVAVAADFEDAATGDIDPVELVFQRGGANALVRQRNGTSIPSDLQTMLDPITSDWGTDPAPAQGLRRRTEVR